MSESSTDAVRARVAAADNDDVLVLRRQIASVFMIAVEQAFRVGMQELHGEMDSVKAATLNAQIARSRSTSAEDNGVELCHQLIRSVVSSHLDTRDEMDSLFGHQVNASLNDSLLKLHVRDTVHEQAAHTVCALEDRHRMPRAIELRGASET